MNLSCITEQTLQEVKQLRELQTVLAGSVNPKVLALIDKMTNLISQKQNEIAIMLVDNLK